MLPMADQAMIDVHVELLIALPTKKKNSFLDIVYGFFSQIFFSYLFNFSTS